MSKKLNLKKIISNSFIYLSLITAILLNTLEIVPAKEKQKETPQAIPKILNNNESTEYEGLKIASRGNSYYYIFDLVENNEDMPEIYFPSGLYVFPVEHHNFQKIKKYMIKIPFLNKIKMILTSCKYQVKAMISKEGFKVKSAIMRRENSKISSGIMSLNRKYEMLIKKLTMELGIKIIVKDLTNYIAKKKFPITMASKRRTSDNFVSEKFEAIPYPLKPVPGGETKDFLLAMIGVNVEIHNKWSRGFNNLADLSNRMRKKQKKLSKAYLPSKIRNRIRKLQETFTNWISAIIQLNHDTRNYKSHLETLEKMLSKAPAGGKRREKIINFIKINIPRIKAEIEKIKEREISEKIIEDLLVKNKSLINVKTLEIDNYYEQRKFFRNLNGDIKRWANQYNSAPRDILTFSEIYDENKKKWQKVR